VLPTVPIAERRVDDYAEPAGADTVEALRTAARPLAGARLLHVNSTAFGGGVAELLHTQLGLLTDLGLDVTWAVIEGSQDFYDMTKGVHNALQGAEVELTPAMRETYLDRVRANAEMLTAEFDFVMIHDPQPAALLAFAEELGHRKGKWIWRCHLDLSAPYRPAWEFFEPLVDMYDAIVFTAETYAQPGVTHPLPAFIAPTIDPLSPKNRPLAASVVNAIVGGLGVDVDRPLITQVSRFDPWKDPLGVIDAFRMARREVDGLQLALVGSLAADDPEGLRYLELAAEHRQHDPDIHLLTNLDGVGDYEVNAIQRASAVVVQKSLREGFGLVVSEAMWKERPVVGGNVVGIRMQVEDGVHGFIVDSPSSCAQRIVELLGDRRMAAKMGREGHRRVLEQFSTPRELMDQLQLLRSLAGF
jgi:trehalose synthase